MKKTRIYELAKELNTTSKRLIEKLGEIDISVKNHMSFLDENQLSALYDHIGVIRHKDSSNAEADKDSPEPPKASKRTKSRKETVDIPTIIRKTEIVIDSKASSGSQRFPASTDNKKEIKQTDKKKKRKKDFVKVTDDSSGLRPGLARSTGFDYMNELLNEKKAQRKREEEEKLREEKDSEQKDKNQKEKVSIKPENKPENEKHNEKVAKTQEKKASKSETEAVPDEVLKRTLVSQDNVTGTGNEPKENLKSETKLTQVQAKSEIEHKNIQKEVKADEKDENKYKSMTSETDKTQGSVQTELKKEKWDSKKDVPKTQKRAEKTEADVKNTERKSLTDKSAMNTENKKTVEGHKTSEIKEQRNELSKRKPKFAFDNRKDEDKNIDKTSRIGRKDSDQFAKKKRSEPKQLPDAIIPDTINTGLKQEKPKPIKKEYENKYQSKSDKKETKRETVKQSGRNKRVSPESLIIGQKKKVSEVLTDKYELDFLDDTAFAKKKMPKPARGMKKAQPKPKHIPKKAVLTSITVPESLTVKDLAEALKKTSSEVIKKLMGLGVMATLNQEVDFDTATLVADEFGVKTEKEISVNVEDILFDDSEDKQSDLASRPPVVVVMGHVDHGKTSLLDAIRKTNVTVTEAGGITQHIGAYMVEINGRKITFLDTPGHEAFTSMRARGAQVTDVAILVIGADDGIMPQTIEAINHAKAANVTMVIAINKIDKPGANPDKIKQQLTEHGLLPEEWGGDTIVVNVSAIKGTNIDELLEMVILSADVLELKANPNRQAKGTVIEAKLDKNRGAVATLLVQTGTLYSGDALIAGTAMGHIRAMTDDKGEKIESAGPSTPVEILGLDEVPQAGEVFYSVSDERLARQLVDERKQSQREEQIKSHTRVTLEDLFSQIQAGDVKELNIIVKADVQGSVEAVKQSLERLTNDDVKIKIVHGGVGAINESDVKLAEVTNAIIIGFNVRPGANVDEAAKNAGVDMRMYRVIYTAIEDIQAAMKGMLDPTFKEVVIGHAEARQIFKVSGMGTIAGCYVTNGKVMRSSEVRIVRDGIVIHEGKLASLKRFKDDAKEVAQGFECGIMIERFNDIKEGDVIEAFIIEEVREH